MLEESELAHQYYFDADEAIAWMAEQELYMMAKDKANVSAPSAMKTFCFKPKIVLVSEFGDNRFIKRQKRFNFLCRKSSFCT